MPEFTERKTQYAEIIKRQDSTTIVLLDLTHTVEMFVKVHEGEHCNINTKLDEVRLDIYGDDKTMGMREKLRRLWDDAQVGKASNRTIYVAIIICVLTSVFNLVMK